MEATFLKFPELTWSTLEGRYPFRDGTCFEGSMGENIKVRKICDVNLLIKDEVHFELLGPKKLWLNQLRYRRASSHHTKIVLLRNPFSVIQSMHAYHLKYRTHPYWNMACSASRKKFLVDYAEYFKRALQPAFNCLIIDKFFGDENYRKGLLDKLGISVSFGDDIYECSEGHRMSRDHLECECGVVKGQGDFDFSKSVDISRLNKPASSILNDEIIDEVNSFILNNSAFDPYLIKDGEPVGLL